LSNYISALVAPRDIYAEHWPADCHVIGKDIIWFHAVIWPAMLLSTGYPLPRQIYAHGFILDKDGRKMSKHLGNVVDPQDVLKEYSVDVLRYYFLRVFSSGEDGCFSLVDLARRYESELGNDLGNLVLRVAKLIQSRLGGTVRTAGHAPDLDAAPVAREYFERVDAREHHRALEALWAYVRRANAYLNDRHPWKMPDGPDLERVLANGLEALRAIAHLASPAMPRAARSIAESLGFEIGTTASILDPPPGGAAYRVKLCAPLFPRREKGRGDAAAAGPPAAPPKPAAPQAPPKDPFARLELRVGLIEEVREHPDADKLYAMTLDLGSAKRSICAGLRAHLRADELRGRKVLVLANLKPAVLRGVESAGMILATDRKDGKVVPVDPGEAAIGDLAAVEGIASAPDPQVSIKDFEKAPLQIQAGKVTYQGKPLQTPRGPVLCDAEDGARVR
ncbi:MAG: class I tRNA ligase family protein, partial [Planctomycetes bacterium]|nr:class I tRNA ligase family protein [Planctomycetota bacterium]